MKKTICLLFSLLLCVSMLPAWAAADDPTPAPEDAKYVDFDDMTFWINGQKFTLGVNTLQDMIDAGVVFDAEDMEDVNNNLRKNSQSDGFTFYITEHCYAIVKVMNATGKGKRLADCVLSRIYVTFREHTEEAKDSILTFAFPFDLTKEQLLENAGEPDDKSHYDGSQYYSDTYEYRKIGSRYFGYNKINFDFQNEILTYFTMEYLP